MKKYSELLPEYLDGTNIRAHASIIEEQDKKILEKINIIKNWNNLNRPVLIEWVQESRNFAKINIHIHTEAPIKSIRTRLSGGNFIEGEVNEEYSEDDLITDTIISRTSSQDQFGVVMPGFVVVIETYDGQKYEKGYPENEIQTDTIYDHDEFIDIIGNLLGIHRRIYSNLRLDYSEDIYNVYPPAFAKVGKIGYITEDDWYYLQRIQKFIQEYQSKPLPALMADVLFEAGVDDNYYNMKNRKTSLTSELKDYKDTELLILSQTNRKYKNIDYTNMNSIINSYASITRPCIVADGTPKIAWFGDSKLYMDSDFINNVLLEITPVWSDEEYKEIYPFYYAPVDFYFENMETGLKFKIREYSDETGKIKASIPGIQNGTYHVKAVNVPEYEFKIEEGNDAELHNIYVDGVVEFSEDAVKTGEYKGTDVSTIIPPTFAGEIDCGRRLAVYTPIMDLCYVDLEEHTVEISFRSGRNYQRIGIDRLNIGEYITNVDNTWIDPSNYSASDNQPHTLTYKWINKVCYVYLDYNYIGISKDYSNITEGMIYMYAYNPNPINNNGLYIEEVDSFFGVDDNTPPE